MPGDEIPDGTLTDEAVREFRAKGWIQIDSPEIKVSSQQPTPSEPTKKITIPVGVMEASVTAGPDGELGTNDDQVEIKPAKKRRGRPKKRKES